MRRIITFVLMAATALAGLAFSSEDPQVVRGESETFYLRWDAPNDGSTSCGDNRYLSTVAGTDDVVCTQLYATTVENAFSTNDVDGLAIDALADITGTIDLGPAIGVTHGIAVVDATVRIRGFAEGRSFTLGTHTEELIVTPASTATRDAVIDFSMDIDDELDMTTLGALTITVTLDGPQALPWDFNLDGASFFELPFVEVLEPLDPIQP